MVVKRCLPLIAIVVDTAGVVVSNVNIVAGDEKPSSTRKAGDGDSHCHAGGEGIETLLKIKKIRGKNAYLAVVARLR